MKRKIKSKKIYSQITYWLGVVAVGLAVGLSIQFVVAWVEPTAAPPGGNLEAPINVSDSFQFKKAGLMLNTSGISADGLIVANGNVGIGVADPAYKFQVKDSSGRYMSIGTAHGTSGFRVDAGGPEITDHFAGIGYDNNGMGVVSDKKIMMHSETGQPIILQGLGGGNVGIATNTPGEKLEVAGNIRASGTVCDKNGCIGGYVGNKEVYYKEKLYPIPGNDRWNGGLGCDSGDILLGCYIKHRNGSSWRCPEDDRLIGEAIYTGNNTWLVVSENMSDHKCYLWRYGHSTCFTHNYRMVAKCLHL